MHRTRTSPARWCRASTPPRQLAMVVREQHRQHRRGASARHRHGRGDRGTAQRARRGAARRCPGGARLRSAHASAAKVLPSASSRGIEWAAENGARVINMSFAGPADPRLARCSRSGRENRGIVLIAAAGNAGPNSPPLFPAADKNVIAVTATDMEDRVYAGANRGNHIAVAAPGARHPGAGAGRQPISSPPARRSPRLMSAEWWRCCSNAIRSLPPPISAGS